MCGDSSIKRQLVLSSPDITFMGMKSGDAGHDNLSVLKQTMLIASQWRTSKF